MSVTPESSLCPFVARVVGEDGAAFANAHHPRALTLELIADASLVLTASKLERSAVATLDPSARARTFTLTEAAILAGAQGNAGAEALVHAEHASPLERFAATLHARRGLGAAASGRRPAAWWGLLGRHEDTDPLDIADGHNLGERRHQATLSEVSTAVDRIVAGLLTIAV